MCLYMSLESVRVKSGERRKRRVEQWNEPAWNTLHPQVRAKGCFYSDNLCYIQYIYECIYTYTLYTHTYYIILLHTFYNILI